MNKKLVVLSLVSLFASSASAFEFIPGKECNKIVYEKPIEWNTTYEKRMHCSYGEQYTYWTNTGLWQATGTNELKTAWGVETCPLTAPAQAQNINLSDPYVPAFISTITARLINYYQESRVKSRIPIAWITTTIWRDEKGQSCNPDDM